MFLEKFKKFVQKNFEIFFVEILKKCREVFWKQFREKGKIIKEILKNNLGFGKKLNAQKTWKCLKTEVEKFWKKIRETFTKMEKYWRKL